MQLRGTKIVVDEVNAKKPVISISGTARVLNPTESGSVVLFDRAAGNTLTLPDSALPGTWYEVWVSVTPTSNSHKVITGLNGSTNAVIAGGLDAFNVNDDSNKGFKIVEGATSNRFASLAMNGTTTGGQAGTRLTFTALSAGTWFVSGINVGSGVIASPASTATS